MHQQRCAKLSNLYQPISRSLWKNSWPAVNSSIGIPVEINLRGLTMQTLCIWGMMTSMAWHATSKLCLASIFKKCVPIKVKIGILLCKMYSGLAADNLAKMSKAVALVFGFWQVLLDNIENVIIMMYKKQKQIFFLSKPDATDHQFRIYTFLC